MTASRSMQLSPYLQWVIDFTQNIESSAPGTCDLAKLTRVLQDSFHQSEKKTLLVGIQDLSKCDDLIFDALRKIDEKRSEFHKNNKKMDLKTYKECVHEFALLLTHLLAKEQAIYQEVINLFKNYPEQYIFLFGNIKIKCGEPETPAPEEIARDIIKGYGFGLFQHYVAIYGNMVTESRGKNSPLILADAYYFSLFQLNLPEIVRVEGFLNAVKNNVPMTVDAELIDKLVDESLLDTKIKENVSRKIGSINGTTDHMAKSTKKTLKLSSEIALNREQFNEKFKAYFEKREQDAIDYERQTPPHSPVSMSVRSSPLRTIASDLPRSSSAKTIVTSSLASSPARALIPSEPTSPHTSATNSDRKSGTTKSRSSLMNFFKRDKPTSSRSLASSPVSVMATSPRDESAEKPADTPVLTPKKPRSRRKYKSVGSTPSRRKQSSDIGEVPSFFRIFSAEPATAEPTFESTFKEEDSAQPANGIFKLATVRKHKLSGSTTMPTTRKIEDLNEMDDLDKPAINISPTRRASTPISSRREKLSADTRTVLDKTTSDTSLGIKPRK